MNAVRLIPVILSFLLLAAHFYRAGEEVAAGVCVALPVLLFVREWWVPRLLQLLLLVGALEWARTLYLLAQWRIEIDQPWARLVLILGAVAVLTALSGLVFRIPALRERYALDKA